MSFTFNDTIPAANNNPSNDQPVMLANNVATNGILAVDHVTFNNAFGGTHKQVTFSSENTAVTPTDPSSVLFTTPGSASTIADMRFINQNATFPVNLIRAYGVFDATGAIIGTQSINLTVNLGTNPWTAGAGYTIFLNTNVVTGTAFGVLISPNQSGLNPLWGIGYAITSATQINVGFRRVDTNAFSQPGNGFTAIIYQL